MTAIEMKTILIDSIRSINDESIIKKISKYVKKTLSEAKKEKITKDDLVINPIALDIVRNIKGGEAVDAKEEMHKHWEEKYK